jgi:radical SAM protein with 4Fe4S-binding SPASM domain
VDEDYQKVVNENKNLSIIGGCIAGVVSSTITAYGDVLPCPHLRVPVGNIHNSNFSNIWITSDLFNKLRDRENLKGYCKTCFYRAICGGCRAAAYWRTGDIFEQDPCCFKSLL